MQGEDICHFLHLLSLVKIDPKIFCYRLICMEIVVNYTSFIPPYDFVIQRYYLYMYVIAGLSKLFVMSNE